MMLEALQIIVLVIAIGVIVFALFKIGRGSNSEVSIAGELRESRQESAEAASRLREELSTAHAQSNKAMTDTLSELGKAQQNSLDQVKKDIRQLTESSDKRLEELRNTLERKIKEMQDGNEKKLEQMRQESAEAASRLRDELSKAHTQSSKAMTDTLSELGKAQQNSLDQVKKDIRQLTESSDKRLEELRNTLERKIKEMQDGNEKKLEQMRQTVDEKLQSTLEKRLGESFKLVSERLEAVQRGLGDMQNLATGVGDLKRVLTNVKERGTWGEYQLADILSQILTPEQYEKNVRPRPNSNSMVEFAIRLPGADEQGDKPLWLPIDSKFPQEDYQRLLDASESGDTDMVEKSTRALQSTIRSSAKDIANKYIEPPHTTDFAILFLPTEGLYSEVLRQPGMVDELQLKHRVVVAGPTTLSAILNSLRMGFRTLAIEKRSSEVWKILSAVKTEFTKFGDVLDKVKRQLSTASNTLEQTSTRTRVMERTLKQVESLPTDQSSDMLGLDRHTITENDDSGI